MFLTIFILLAIAGAVLALWEIKQRNPKTDVPLPPSISFLELSPRKGETSDQAFDRLKKQYGPVFRVRIPFYANVIIAVSAQTTKMYHMLKNEDANISYGYRLFSLLGLGPSHLKATYKESHFVPLLEKAFSRERYNYFANILRTGIRAYMAENWNKDVQQVDLFAEMYSVNIRLIVRAFMGDFEKHKVDEFIRTVKALDLEERIKSLTRILKNYSPSGRNELEKHWRSTTSLVKELVQYRKEKKDEASGAEFFDFLIAETTDEKGVLDYDLLAARVFMLIFSAVLNTFATSAWFLFRVFDNPEILAKVKQEQEEYNQLLKDPATEPGMVLINKFPYSENCIREVIRTSIAGISVRRALRDFVMSDNGMNYAVPKDTYIFMLYNTIVRDSAIWHDPAEFRPERFETEAKGQCENVIFGAGKHPCTGSKFALLNIKTITFNIMEHYKVDVPGKAEDYMPKTQNMGVFRPIKPVIFTLTKQKPIAA